MCIKISPQRIQSETLKSSVITKSCNERLPILWVLSDSIFMEQRILKDSSTAERPLNCNRVASSLSSRDIRIWEIELGLGIWVSNGFPASLGDNRPKQWSSEIVSHDAAFNLLKPNCYVMHHQFNIHQLYALPTLYLCVLYLSQNKQRLVPLTA